MCRDRMLDDHWITDRSKINPKPALYIFASKLSRRSSRTNINYCLFHYFKSDNVKSLVSALQFMMVMY